MLIHSQCRGNNPACAIRLECLYSVRACVSVGAKFLKLELCLSSSNSQDKKRRASLLDAAWYTDPFRDGWGDPSMPRSKRFHVCSPKGSPVTFRAILRPHFSGTGSRRSRFCVRGDSVIWLQLHAACQAARSPATARTRARQMDVSAGNPRGENGLFRGSRHTLQMCPISWQHGVPKSNAVKHGFDWSD